VTEHINSYHEKNLISMEIRACLRCAQIHARYCITL